MNPLIHWFRRDLRLTDNTALSAAVQTNQPIIPLFIFDPTIILSQRVSIPRLGWLIASLEALDESLREQGRGLTIAYGDPKRVFEELIRISGADRVYFNRDYTPFALKRDSEIEKSIQIQVHAFDDVSLLPPGTVLTGEGKPFTVFTPFKRKWLTIPKPELQGDARILPRSVEMTETISPERLKDFLSEGTPVWLNHVPRIADFGITQSITLPEAGERVAIMRLEAFLNQRVYDYDMGRNRLASEHEDDTLNGSSFLSPYFRFGMMSSRQTYWRAREAYTKARNATWEHSVESWVSELIWRDFYTNILFHFPHVLKGSFRRGYDRVEWRHAPDELQAWKDGMTGYPVVDAAMRQLGQMGWMPNRARMIVASFLSKDLLIHWREGERHFMDWLIDGDPAANNGGWQWSAGTGTDAQPYFRIFNPVSQSKQFDPDGVYIRRWIPELREAPAHSIHAPWLMDSPPNNYPPPIVDHQIARERTLAAFKGIKT